MDERKIFILLLNHEFYTKNKHRVLRSFFPEELKPLYDTVKEAQEKYQRDLTIAELRSLHNQKNPTMTRAAKDALNELFRLLNEEEPIGLDVGESVIHSLYKKEVGRKIAEEGLKITEGGQDSLLGIKTIIEEVNDNFMPVETVEHTPSDIEEVMLAMADRPCWKFNLETLSEKVPGGGPGDFVIVFARPEVGKTASWVSFTAGPDGYLHQGAKVLAIINEEPAIRTMARLISAASGKSFEDIKKNPEEVKNIWNPLRSNLIVLDDTGMTMERLDSLCEKYKPDIVIVDQLDKLSMSGEGGVEEHHRLRQIYTEARNIAKRRTVLLIGISQASAEAEDKTYVHFSMMDNSKTGKAAQADLILGIGKINQTEGSGVDERIRHILVSKNKLNGWHGKVHAVLDNAISRYTS